MARNDGVENVMPRDSLYVTEKLLPSVNVNTAKPVSSSISTDLNRLFVVSLASTPVLLPFTVQKPFLSMPTSGTDVATGILLPSFIAALEQKADNLGSQLKSVSDFASGNLISRVGTDENGNYVITYKTKDGEKKTVILAKATDLNKAPMIGVAEDGGIVHSHCSSVIFYGKE